MSLKLFPIKSAKSFGLHKALVGGGFAVVALVRNL
jgi:hypothetical protein